MRLVLTLFIAALFFSCNTYNKLLKSDNPEEKLKAAIEYYESGSYFRALQLLESVLPSYRGTVEAEKIYYYYAYSHYHQGDYLVAAFHFMTLAKTLPNSQYAEESLFMSAYCKYLYSPDFNLDQTSTKEAIQEMQLFINKFPKSAKVAEANKLIDEMRAKMERKAFENARLYFILQEYQAAVVSLQNVIRDFPGTTYTEEAMFLIVKSWYMYASGSIATKQRERYEKAKESYQMFINDFPTSKFKNEATFYYNASVKNIERIISDPNIVNN
jgi:outer membrane protein assembly factor BamD